MQDVGIDEWRIFERNIRFEFFLCEIIAHQSNFSRMALVLFILLLKKDTLKSIPSYHMFQ